MTPLTLGGSLLFTARRRRHLVACLAEQVIQRDAELFADILRGFRHSVQSIDFQGRMAIVRTTEDAERKHLFIRDAVLEVFLQRHIPPVFRTQGAHERFMRLLEPLKVIPGDTGHAFGHEHRGYKNIVFEPDGNVVPDFLVNGKIAVEFGG